MTTKRQIAPEEKEKEKTSGPWHFWKGRPAPSIKHSFNPFTKTNAILRSKAAPPPPPLTIHLHHPYIVSGPIQIPTSKKSAKEIAKLWNDHSQIGDWSIRVSELDVMDILQAPGTIAIGIHTPGVGIVGTILSRPLRGISLVGEKDCELRIVEGLVLHPELRGGGAAGWLIGWLDHLTSAAHPTTHIWFRETCKQQQSVLPKSVVRPAASDYVAQTTLTKLMEYPDQEPPVQVATPVSWKSVSPILHALWSSYSIVFHPDQEPTNLSWWRSDIPGFPTAAILVGIARTKRIHASLDLPLYNVVFSCFVRIQPESPLGMTDPFWNNTEEPMCDMIREGIEAAAIAQKCDILQVYSPSPSFGSGSGSGSGTAWNNRKWTILRKQKRKMYMYNRIPPGMGYSTMLFPYCGI